MLACDLLKKMFILRKSEREPQCPINSNSVKIVAEKSMNPINNI